MNNKTLKKQIKTNIYDEYIDSLNISRIDNNNLTVKLSNVNFNKLGLFATKYIYSNTTIGVSHISVKMDNTNKIFLPKEFRLIATAIGGVLNHSETDYNCVLLKEEVPEGLQSILNVYKLINIEDIQKGSELIVNYKMIECLSYL